MPRRSSGQGSLRQRDGRWISQTRDPLTGKVLSRSHPPGTSAKAAEKAHQAWLAEIASRKVATSGLTVEGHLQDWLRSREGRVKPGTIYRQRTDVRRVCRYIGAVRLQELTARHIDGLMIDLTRSYSPGTVGATRATLSSALRRARAWGRIERSPMDDAEPVRKPRTEEVFVPTTAQLQTMITGETDPLWRTLWVVMAGTGMRPGEAMALHWRHVDLDAAEITVRTTITVGEGGRRVVGDTTKTTKWRTVSLGADVVAALRSWRHQLGAAGLWRIGPDAPLWESSRNPGQPYGHLVMRERFNRRLKAASADARCTPKSLRHWHASTLLAAGTPPQQVADRLGHSIDECLRTYGHHVPDETRTALLRHLPSFNADADTGR